MSTLIKDIYSSAFYSKFADILSISILNFDNNKFIDQIFTSGWESKELKDRMRHTASVLHNFLPDSFAEAAPIIETIITKLKQNNFTESNLEFMFFPEYIEMYGIEHFDVSVKTIEFVTQFTSCEFAVRPFIIKYGDKMLAQMLQWSLHENHKVRRLASEGTRPRLPWAIALPELKKNPKPILPLLENLKNDPSEWVRRSVANNLNDIAKDNPEIVIEISEKWKNTSKETDAIIKHGCRTLLKQGHSDMLNYFGLINSEKIVLSDFKIHTPEVKVGQDLLFSFSITNQDQKSHFIRLEYALYYLRQKGQTSKKVFKISEKQYPPNTKTNIQRKQSFKIITTRRFYSGKHRLSIIINGQELEFADFELTD